ncbi:MAG TPA: hypothetical protein VG602_01395, partial [Actinomycetota bacterium]|nr:hypothetical protein [Actinomycetota bacterium]
MPVTEREVRRALRRATEGKSLSASEATALLAARGPALADLLRVAADLRELGQGRAITYSRKVFVPLT